MTSRRTVAPLRRGGTPGAAASAATARQPAAGSAHSAYRRCTASDSATNSCTAGGTPPTGPYENQPKSCGGVVAGAYQTSPAPSVTARTNRPASSGQRTGAGTVLPSAT